jgi:hypothetical protein
MKPFNLEKAVAGEKLVTRDGRKISEFVYLKTESSASPCVAVIGGSPFWFSKDGLIHGCHGEDSPADLFMAPKVITKYLNVYDSSAGGSYDGNNSYIFDKKEEAEGNADRNSVKVLIRAQPIQWEEK